MTNYSEGDRAVCPHCRTVVRFEETYIIYPGGGRGDLGSVSLVSKYHGGNRVTLDAVSCPACGDLVVALTQTNQAQRLVLPLQSNRAPVPDEVPEHIASDYTEAALVLTLSPTASAALSRRCLQAILRDQAYTQRDLSQQIDAALPNLPSHVAASLDAIRNIGNFAAHPSKDHNTGEIVDVEPGEAEWNLDVLDSLFDFYYVAPAREQAKRDALNAKLRAMGKPPMK